MTPIPPYKKKIKPNKSISWKFMLTFLGIYFLLVFLVLGIFQGIVNLRPNSLDFSQSTLASFNAAFMFLNLPIALGLAVLLFRKKKWPILKSSSFVTTEQVIEIIAPVNIPAKPIGPYVILYCLIYAISSIAAYYAVKYILQIPELNNLNVPLIVFFILAIVCFSSYVSVWQFYRKQGRLFTTSELKKLLLWIFLSIFVLVTATALIAYYTNFDEFAYYVNYRNDASIPALIFFSTILLILYDLIVVLGTLQKMYLIIAKRISKKNAA